MSSRRSSFAAIPFVPLVLLSIASFAAAQPRPAVAIRQHATMLRSVWPADFNRDGHVDFVAGEPGPASGTPGRVVVRLGNGGGGVGQPIATGVTGQPAAVGDFNRDALVDVVAVDDAGGLWMLAGRGNGTFQAARALDPMPEFFRFGLAADMNGDGRLDLVVGGGTTVQVRRVAEI